MKPDFLELAEPEPKKVNPAKLTPSMQQLIAHMKRHNNKVVRYPGGFWAAENWNMWSSPYFGTSTIEALVARGIATYTVWKDGRNGKFPIECILKDGKE